MHGSWWVSSFWWWSFATGFHYFSKFGEHRIVFCFALRVKVGQRSKGSTEIYITQTVVVFGAASVVAESRLACFFKMAYWRVISCMCAMWVSPPPRLFWKWTTGPESFHSRERREHEYIRLFHCVVTKEHVGSLHKPNICWTFDTENGIFQTEKQIDPETLWDLEVAYLDTRWNQRLHLAQLDTFWLYRVFWSSVLVWDAKECCTDDIL